MVALFLITFSQRTTARRAVPPYLVLAPAKRQFIGTGADLLLQYDLETTHRNIPGLI